MKKPDYYAKKAKEDHYAARSVYKLEEIQKKYKLLKKNMRIIDLGCAPGSWSQYAHQIIGDKGFLLGIDLQEIQLNLGLSVRFIQKDIFNVNFDNLLNIYGQFDGLISDMAPATTGNKDRDHYASMELCEQAFIFTCKLVKENGFFVCKMFDGEDSPDFIRKLRKYFTFFKTLRPKATKKSSREVFLIGTGLKNV